MINGNIFNTDTIVVILIWCDVLQLQNFISLDLRNKLELRNAIKPGLKILNISEFLSK